MKHTSAIFAAFFTLVFHSGLMQPLQAQTHPDQFQIPEGWVLVDNWLSPFQATFGLDADLNDFHSLHSESDFLLYHPEHRAFLMVWAEAVASHEIYTGNRLISQPAWGLKTTGISATEYFFPVDPAHSKRLRMTLFTAAGYTAAYQLPEGVTVFAASWQPDTMTYGAADSAFKN